MEESAGHSGNTCVVANSLAREKWGNKSQNSNYFASAWTVARFAGAAQLVVVNLGGVKLLVCCDRREIFYILLEYVLECMYVRTY